MVEIVWFAFFLSFSMDVVELHRQASKYDRVIMRVICNFCVLIRDCAICILTYLFIPLMRTWNKITSSHSESCTFYIGLYYSLCSEPSNGPCFEPYCRLCCGVCCETGCGCCCWPCCEVCYGLYIFYLAPCISSSNSCIYTDQSDEQESNAQE